MMKEMIAVVAVLLASGVARGDPEQAAETGQRSFGFGPEAGLFGIGGAIHAGGPAYGGFLAASLTPVIVVQSSTSTFNLFATGDVRANLYAYTVATERGHLGPFAGASYNTLLGVGFNLGAGGTLRLGRKVDLSFKWVFSFFPDATDRLSSHIDQAKGDPGTPWLQSIVTIGLLFYP